MIYCLLTVALFVSSTFGKRIKTLSGTLDYSEEWNYTEVRPNAHMFWWLYHASSEDHRSCDSNRPLIMWLQGGPGGSSCGYGNFKLIGPLDADLNPRNATWLQKADLLFVDNPVGTGFSYVTEKCAYTVNVEEIAEDLLTLTKQWFLDHPQYSSRPFYVIGESYGGKMGVAFANVLYPAMLSGKVRCNFKGVALGNSWISPMDYVNQYGPFLHYFSMFADSDLEIFNKYVKKCQRLVDNGQWFNATQCWRRAQNLVFHLTLGVQSWYNVLKQGGSDPYSMLWKQSEFSFATRKSVSDCETKPGSTWEEALNKLMNGQLRERLGIIPRWLNFGCQHHEVFDEQRGDFMKPVVSTVDNLLANTSLKVVVYQGQLDLICCTAGTEAWMRKLTWSGMSDYYNKTQKIKFQAGPSVDETAGFYKNFKNLYFFWILRAGHMVPGDAPYAALKMLDVIFQ